MILIHYNYLNNFFFVFYRQKRKRKVLSVNEENETITFQQIKVYTFREELSHGPESDIIHMINVPLVVIIIKIP